MILRRNMNMQTNTLKSYLLIGAGAAAVWMALNPKQNVNKVKNMTASIKDKITPTKFKETDVVPVMKAGNPDPLDLEDNKMVSEGSMYGVDYYNENLQQTR